MFNQRDAGPGLELSYAAAEGRVGDVTGRRRPREAAGSSQGGQVFEQARVQRHAVILAVAGFHPPDGFEAGSDPGTPMVTLTSVGSVGPGVWAEGRKDPFATGGSGHRPRCRHVAEADASWPSR